MPTRLEVLLQRRKSAAAELFHRHITANASAGNKPAVTRAEKGLGRWESSGIIQRSYINSLTISRGRAGAVNGRVVFFGPSTAEMPPGTLLFAPRYGKICDNFPSNINIPRKTAR
jgi:hypothetical protein